jgi:hypothetical protein
LLKVNQELNQNDGMHFYEVILSVVAVWRITHLLTSEDGPGDLLVRFRVRLGKSLLGSLMDCFYCLSIWVAVPFAFLGVTWKERALLWPALSGAAILLERMTGHSNTLAPPPYYETDEHAMRGKGEE